jgi:hypothetical protein
MSRDKRMETREWRIGTGDRRMGTGEWLLIF